MQYCASLFASSPQTCCTCTDHVGVLLVPHHTAGLATQAKSQGDLQRAPQRLMRPLKLLYQDDVDFSALDNHL